MIKRVVTLAGAILFLIAVNLASAMDSEILNVVKRITHKKILPLAKEPILVNAVREANKKAVKSPDEIIQLDKRWRATEGIDEWITGFLNNACAYYLKKFQKDAARGERNLYSEIFVMDKQGNIVAETDKTTDYWQGDEDKFIKSFADGKGVVFIDEPVFDESSERYSVQVSAPVLDPDTHKAIGAITVGIDLDILAEQFVY
ncbi:MAG: hypothetical protein A2166_06350 [Omnitrophica WOR_2 bacterium RBG_13_41_10]|nr:MAG: hypothetical protein A2166_06350 [Omnitrophica WOR_2 bacterium RBG_13_41_10]